MTATLTASLQDARNQKNLPHFAPSEGQWLVPSSDLDQYIARVRQIPVLSAEEEQTLAEEFYDHKKIAAAQKLVLHHLRYVVHIARGFSGYGLPLGDLIQEGNVGLMKAVKRFDPHRGVRLISFAVYWIKSEIHEYVLKNWRIVRVATTKAQRKLFFNLRSMKNSLGWLNQSEAQAIAEELNVPTEQVFEMESRMNGQDIAIDPSPEDYEEDKEYRAPNAWLSDEAVDPAHIIEQDEHSARLEDQLANGLNVLDPRSRSIIQSRWLREDGSKATLQELGEKYGISAERVRQIEQNALQELKTYIQTRA